MNKKVLFILIITIILELLVGVLLVNEKQVESKAISLEEFNVGEKENDNKDEIQNLPIAVETVAEEIDIEQTEEPENIIASAIITENPTADTYYIKVNNQMNTVTIYIQDENGEYTIPVKAMICSTGDETFKNAIYKLNYKRWIWQPLFGDVYGQYATHIYGNILFHSVPYLADGDNSSLEYWEYDKLGTTCSAGCVRLTVEDAKWIYDNCPYGTTVEFYDSEDPGPLGKPSIMPISEYEEYRDWDPTDPDENNPWKEIL